MLHTQKIVFVFITPVLNKMPGTHCNKLLLGLLIVLKVLKTQPILKNSTMQNTVYTFFYLFIKANLKLCFP